LQLAAEDRLQSGAELRADVPRTDGEAEHLAVHLVDRMAGNVVHGRDQHSSSTSGIVVMRRPRHSRTSGQNGSRPCGTMSTGVIPTAAAPASSSFAPSPT